MLDGIGVREKTRAHAVFVANFSRRLKLFKHFVFL